MSAIMEKNPTDSVKSVLGLAPVTATAGGSGDNVAQIGPAIDTLGYKWIIAQVIAECAISSAKKVDFTVQLTHCATSGGSYTNFGDAVTATINDGSDETGIIKLIANIEGAKRYIKLSVTANPDAANTDTANFGASVLLGGSQVIPAV